MTNKTKLKPCPFCARTNIEVIPWQWVDGVYQKVMISCVLKWEKGELECPAVPKVLGDNYEHAAKLWNTRKGTNK